MLNTTMIELVALPFIVIIAGIGIIVEWVWTRYKNACWSCAHPKHTHNLRGECDRCSCVYYERAK